MFIFGFFGSLMVAGVVAYFFEKWDLSHNGIVPSILLAWGAVLVFWMFGYLFNISFGSRGLDAIIASSAALVLIPTEYASKRRKRRSDRRR